MLPARGVLDRASGGCQHSLGLDVDHIYWAGTSQTISSANLDGSDPQTLVSGQSGPIGVAVDASHLYWTNQNDGSIWEANRDGSSPHVISSAGLAGWDIAVGGGHLYWTVLGRCIDDNGQIARFWRSRCGKPASSWCQGTTCPGHACPGPAGLALAPELAAEASIIGALPQAAMLRCRHSP